MKRIFLFLTALVSLASASDLIKFNDTSSGSWNDFKSIAAKENKLIFIDAYTDWCIWCKVMDKETFSDPVVADFMNKHFVNVRYEMETGFGITMSAKYRVSAFPTFLIFSADGKLVNRIIGYHKSKEFLEKLNIALDSATQDHLAGVTQDLEPGFPDFYKASFGKKEVRVRPDSATVNSFLAAAKNLYAEVPYSVMFRFYSLLTPEYKNFAIDHYDTLKYLYGKSDLETIAGSYVNGKLALAIKDNSEDELAGVITLAKKYFPESAQDYELNYRIRFYQGTKQWNRYADVVEKGIAGSQIEENGTNSYAWTVYERCDDKPIVARATAWMEKVVRQFPKYMFVDTYAALLFKNGEVTKAKEFAEKAIALGKDEKADVQETQDLLAKINSQLKPTKTTSTKKK